MPNNIVVLNISEYLTDNCRALGEEHLKQVLSEFLCPINTDVENFLKNQSIDFAKKHQSVTYLVFSDTDAELLGYFTLTIKPIVIKRTNEFSNSLMRKIARVSELDENTDTYTLSAYLIAQLGKNYFNNANKRISGKQLLQAAIDTIKKLQYMAGGTVMFLEAENKEKLIRFYTDNDFKSFSIRKTQQKTSDNQEHSLIQFLKVI